MSLPELDLGELGFEGIDPAAVGMPSYHPEVLLKIYLYVTSIVFNPVTALERETQRNIELMGLTGRLMSDYMSRSWIRYRTGWY